MMIYCGMCNEICESKVEDYGIGPYEHFGERGVHRCLVRVSKCCDAPVFYGIEEAIRFKEAEAAGDTRKADAIESAHSVGYRNE